MLPWQFWLVGDEDTEPSLVLLGFDLATYLTLSSSVHSGHCAEQAWRYLLASVKRVSDAVDSGEVPEGEWGNFPRA